MKIWIDGDSFPKPAMDIVLELRRRVSFELTVLADRDIPDVSSEEGVLRVVAHGSGAVDETIVKETDAGDMVITRDFYLGLRLLEKGVRVMNDRGRIWDLKSLSRRIREAEIMNAARAGGIARHGARSYDIGDRKSFADALNKIVSGQREQIARP